MSQTKVAITIEEGVLARVDALVKRKVFSNRSRAIQEAVQEKLELSLIHISEPTRPY